MDMKELIPHIDEQIARLQQARSILLGSNGHKFSMSSKGKKVSRVLSADARKRIADAQKRRWAKVKKATK